MRTFENMVGRIAVLIGLSLATLASTSRADQPGKSPVKVFILVGQSNMQGKGKIVHLDQLVREKADEYGHLKKDGQWVEREDVWIKYWDKKGKLTVGYGSPEDRIGPELGFGRVIGDALESQVLIIKVAWGGQSLALDFRPPSSGKPDFELSEKVRQKIADGQWQIGIRYREMVAEVNATLKDLKTHFPAYDGRGCEIAGLVWFQGFNDVINDTFRAEYGKNMVSFVRDVRKDLKVPNLPIVIGELGMAGLEVNPRYAHKHYAVREAQEAPSKLPEFKGTVGFARTAPFVVEEGDGFDGGYHYRGRADTFYKIGVSFGEEMKKLIGP
jgi:alpha-galactosidase